MSHYEAEGMETKNISKNKNIKKTLQFLENNILYAEKMGDKMLLRREYEI